MHSTGSVPVRRRVRSSFFRPALQNGLAFPEARQSVDKRVLSEPDSSVFFCLVFALASTSSRCAACKLHAKQSSSRTGWTPLCFACCKSLIQPICTQVAHVRGYSNSERTLCRRASRPTTRGTQRFGAKWSGTGGTSLTTPDSDALRRRKRPCENEGKHFTRPA